MQHQSSSFRGLWNQREILEAGLVQFKDVFPTGHRFQQDNDPKHCSQYTQQKLQELGIMWWKTPAESPDLNNVWGSMKTLLRNEHKPHIMDDLKEGIKVLENTNTTGVSVLH